MDERISFLITIDTEGDNLWNRPEVIETTNTRQLVRFQELCNKFSFKPTYLTTYEMAMDREFVSFGKKYLKANQCEIGAHLHAWNSPPLKPLTESDFRNQPYLIHYDPDVMEEKIVFLTNLLQDRFEDKITSHRSGRWAINEIYMNLLEKYRYTVDCSVTPGISWNKCTGGKPQTGGSDYRAFPRMAYHPSKDNIAVSGDMRILEVPVSIVKKPRSGFKPLSSLEKNVFGKVELLDKICTVACWIRPNTNNLSDMIDTVNCLQNQGVKYIQFALHSSEMSKGLNPIFLTEESIEKLFNDMEKLFQYISPIAKGETMNEFYRRMHDEK